jgi:hypothetical protein
LGGPKDKIYHHLVDRSGGRIHGRASGMMTQIVVLYMNEQGPHHGGSHCLGVYFTNERGCMEY